MNLSVRLLPDFLAPDECEHVIALIRAHVHPSTITTQVTTPEHYDPTFRTSQTCDLGLIQDAFLDMLETRMSLTANTPVALGEPLQGQLYEVGQEFKAHHDCFAPNELEQFSTPGLGQRVTTLMIYLNTTPKGGHTWFPRLGMRLTPQRGLAVLWNNVSEVKPNPWALHQALPVQEGFKAIVTKWYRLPRAS